MITLAGGRPPAPPALLIVVGIVVVGVSVAVFVKRERELVYGRMLIAPFFSLLMGLFLLISGIVKAA